MSEVTVILERARTGDPEAAADLLAAVYNELRQLAAAKLARETPGQTLQATALVHEAWLRLGAAESRWDNRGHFFAAAAEAMRRILIEVARSKSAVRHGGGLARLDLDTQIAAPEAPGLFLELNSAIDRLAAAEPFQAEVVKLKYFGGLEHSEIAGALGVSEKTVQRAWKFAKAWLYTELRDRK